MVKHPRQMALTPDLVALAHRIVADPGPDADFVYQTDEDYNSWVGKMLASHPPGQDAWLFACGSLIWKPEVEHVEARRGTAHGWHRSFCFRMPGYRGTKELPGLMMALDRGGRCRGVLHRLPAQNLDSQFGKLFRREFTVKPQNNMPRWISVEADQGKVRAITFVMNRDSPLYVGRLAPEAAADILAQACGPVGSCAEYLHNTVAHLEELGIHDQNLWRLQEMVANRISARAGRPISG